MQTSRGEPSYKTVCSPCCTKSLFNRFDVKTCSRFNFLNELFVGELIRTKPLPVSGNNFPLRKFYQRLSEQSWGNTAVEAELVFLSYLFESRPDLKWNFVLDSVGKNCLPTIENIS